VELIFIRHGHGEHLVDYPSRLNMLHPGLTKLGVYQINQIYGQLTVSQDDLVLVSPTERTLQTAELLLLAHACTLRMQNFLFYYATKSIQEMKSFIP
jgi:broad specificity phosphatase PhoE